MSVLFGTMPSLSVTYVSDTQITAVVPNGSGTVNITVQSGQQEVDNVSSNPNANVNAPIFGYGTSAVTSAAQFTFVAGLAGDANHDGIVNGEDIAVVASHWLGNGPAGDVNFDGIVNGQDIAVIATHWLQTAGSGSGGPAAQVSGATGGNGAATGADSAIAPTGAATVASTLASVATGGNSSSAPSSDLVAATSAAHRGAANPLFFDPWTGDRPVPAPASQTARRPVKQAANSAARKVPAGVTVPPELASRIWD